MRLRRAGAGGLAAAVIAGALVATAGTAFATLAATGASFVTTTSPVPSVSPGTNLTVGNLRLSITNAWNPGDTLVLKTPATCAAAGNNVGWASAPTVAVTGPTTTAGGTTAGSSSDTTPTFGSPVLSSSSAACTALGVKDTLTLTMTNASTGTTGDYFNFAITNVKYNIDPGVPAGSLTTTAQGFNAGTTAAWTALSAVNATVVQAGFAVAPVTPLLPVGTTAATGVKVGTATFSEVTKGVLFQAGVATTATITLGSGALFTAGITPTITASAGYTITKAASTAAAAYSFTVTGPATLTGPATVSVSGLTATVPASTVAGTAIQLTPGVSATPAPSAAASLAAQHQTAINVVNYASRIGGSDRYATAANLFNSQFGACTASVGPPVVTCPANANATNVVLASGALFPDALSADFLSGQLKTGILLTTPNVLPSVTRNALVNGKITTVYILGGTGAVSALVQNAISDLHVGNNPSNAFLNVIRIGGSDRYQTNKMVVEYFGPAAGVTTAIVASGANFPDALSAGPVSWVKGYPLILTTPAALSSTASALISEYGIKNVAIAGGTGAVSAATETAIKALGVTTARLAGTDRTETAGQVATWAIDGFTATGAFTDSQGFDSTTIFIANGADFPDALAAGPVAGATGTTGSVILLTNSPTSLGAGTPDFLDGRAGTVDTLTALGLAGAVSPTVMASAASFG